MTTKIIVPELGESVVEATVEEWVVSVGDAVNVGDILVSLETDKVALEVAAEVAGVLTAITRASGEDVEVGDVLGEISGDGAAPAPAAPAPVAATPAASAPSPAPAAAPSGANATPVARRMAEAEGVDLSKVQGTGARDQITKTDVARAMQPAPAAAAPKPAAPAPSVPGGLLASLPSLASGGRVEERVKLTRRRKTIAKRLVEAQSTAAMLTTFNEIDMHAIMDLRKRRQEGFVKREGIKLGFMSIFVKAAVAALREFPMLNAEITDEEMILKKYYDIGVAVGTEEGLVVPVVRDADKQSFADIERNIKDLAGKARSGKLALNEIVGGTFTITNGGIYGSMMSTPILNSPQVGILGMHNIVKRAVVVNDEIVIRPVMYVALSYDHRIVDGAGAVGFLYRIKQMIEDPEELMLAG